MSAAANNVPGARPRGTGEATAGRCRRSGNHEEVQTINETRVFELADRALDRAVAQIRDDQWDIQMPASFATRRDDHVPSLRDVVSYHAYDDAWVPAMLSGAAMAQVGVDAVTGDLLGADPPQPRSRRSWTKRWPPPTTSPTPNRSCTARSARQWY